MSLFAKILIKYLSRKMNQLNIPLSPLETSRGMSSEIIRLVDKEGNIKYTCWLRKIIKSGNIVYAGFYTTCYIDELKETFVKTVFPLPHGNVIVILKALIMDDGSLKLVSSGKKIGGDGYYRNQYSSDHRAKTRFIPLKETIHVFEDEESCLRTDHIFKFFGMKMLHLHYKILDK